MFVRIYQVNLFKSEYCINDELGFGHSACDVTATCPSSLRQVSSSYTIGPARAWLSNITMENHLMILNHDVERIITDKRQSVILSVP